MRERASAHEGIKSMQVDLWKKRLVVYAACVCAGAGAGSSAGAGAGAGTGTGAAAAAGVGAGARLYGCMCLSQLIKVRVTFIFGVATMSKLPKNIVLFYKRAL